jgi:hypothetical protein
VLQRRSAADLSPGGGCVLTRWACLLALLAAVACSGAPGAERSDRASLQAGVDSAANRGRRVVLAFEGLLAVVLGVGAPVAGLWWLLKP